MVPGFASWLPAVAGSLAVVGVASAVGGRWLPRSSVAAGAGALAAVAVVALAVAGALSTETALVAAMALALVVSLSVVYRIDDPAGGWGRRLRSRFVMGVPWGTLVVSLFVLGVYLVVQDGWSNWSSPLVVPFRAWSYRYPLGVVTAPFAHAGPGHLVGNLTGTLVLGTVVEYAWGHFPRERGSSSFGSWRTNPWVRALVVFPGAIVVVGVATTAVAIGPVVGFSGVVFALAGVALTRYPLGTVVAAAGASGVRTAYGALQQPVVVETASASPPSAPWWAEIAIQGHALGLFVGVLVGWYLFADRGGPSALRIWVGVVLYATEQALWAVYWFRGENTYVLYRGPGIVLVATLALLVAAALTASDRPLVPDRLRPRFRPGDRRLLTVGPGDAPDEDPTRADGGDPDDRDPEDATAGDRLDSDAGSDPGDGGDTSPDRPPARTTGGGIATDSTDAGDAGSGAGDDQEGGLRDRLPDLLTGDVFEDVRWTRRTVAVALLVVGLWALSIPGIGSNVFAPAASDPAGDVEVRGYSVFYAESVTNEMVAVVDITFLNLSTNLTTSGVIVSNPGRDVWQQAVSRQRLAFSGRAAVDVGGVGWHERVVAERRGWSTAGGGTAYKVWLTPPDGDRRLVYRSTPKTATPTIAGRNVTVLPAAEGFRLAVTRHNRTLGVAPIPDAGNATRIAGLRLVNREGTITAEHNRTSVDVARRETYN